MDRREQTICNLPLHMQRLDDILSSVTPPDEILPPIVRPPFPDVFDNAVQDALRRMLQMVRLRLDFYRSGLIERTGMVLHIIISPRVPGSGCAIHSADKVGAVFGDLRSSLTKGP